MVAGNHLPWLVWDMAQWAICKLGKVLKIKNSVAKDLAIRLANVMGKSSFEAWLVCSCP